MISMSCNADIYVYICIYIYVYIDIHTSLNIADIMTKELYIYVRINARELTLSVQR
jgi:hypothetical protein